MRWRRVRRVCPNAFIARTSSQLLVVVRLAFDDGAGAVDLLGEDEAYHLVREGHLGEGKLFVGTGVDGRGEAVWASDDKDESAGGVALLLQPAGELDTAQLATMFVEQHDGIRRLNLFQDEFTLGSLLLFFRETFRVLEFGNGDQFEGHVVADSFDVVANACLEVAVGSLAYEYQQCLHTLIPFDGFSFDELFKLALVAIEHVDVDIALDASYTTIGTELPEGQTDIGLVLTVTGNPHAVVTFQVGLFRQVVVHEHLVDIEDGLDACAALDGPEPDANLLEHAVGTHLLDLRLGGLDVEHGWQVAVLEERIPQEMLRLISSRGAHRPEVVGTNADVTLAGLGIVAGIELVADSGALRRLDEDERDGIVGCAADIMAATLADVDDAQLVPVDGYGAAPLAVLVFRDVDTVDALRGVTHALAHEAVLAPFACLQTRLVAVRVEQLYAEALTEIVCKVSLRVAAVGQE